MSWRDELVDASFRGVPFLIKASDLEGGRRQQVHQLPGSIADPVIVEDLGLRGRRYSIEAFVVGDDYFDQRDKLLEALEKPGPGTLSHPFYGEFPAEQDGPVHVKETTDEGGMARFSLLFIRGSKAKAPAVRVSTVDDVQAKCEEARQAAVTEFAESFTVLGAIASVVTRIMSAVNAVLDKLNAARALVQGAIDAVDTVSAAIKEVRDTALGLLLLPSQMANSFVDLYGSVFGWVGTGTGGEVSDLVDQVGIARGLVGQLFPSRAEYITDAETASEQRARDNAHALDNLIAAAVVIEASRTASQLQYVSYEQAMAMRDTIVDAVDLLIPEVGDTLYASLVLLRASIIAHLNVAASGLPQIVEFTPLQTGPSLAISYRLYGDATREAEIIARNNVRHPGFVPGGQTLQVIARG